MGGGNGKPSLLFSPSHKSFLSMDTFDRIPIVPLDQAIEPLLLLIPSIQTYVDLVKGKCRVPADGLTSDQSAAIMLYCIVWRPREQCLYTRFNAVLQSRSPQQLKPWLFYVKLLFSALLQLPSIDLTVYRGSQSNLQQQYSLDQTITWLELSLSTGSLEYLESDACLGKKGVRTICTIRGSTVKDIHQHTYDASNRLALFLPGRRFKVIESFNQTEDLHCLTLKEIESDLLAARFWPSQKKNIAHSSVPLHDHQRTATLEHRILEHTQSWIIDLDKQDLTDHDMSIVVKQALMKTHCRRIRLRDNHITFQGSSILAQGLLHNTTLESLDLRHNLISDLGIKSLAMSIAQSNIKTLNLESNEITAEGALHLFQMLRDSRSLTELYLSKNHLGDRGVEFLAKALTDPNAKNSQRQGQRTFRVSTLQHLYLGQNEITDDGIEHLARMLESNRTLTWLWLTGNEIGNRGVKFLSNTLADQNSTLEWLFLNSNKLITDASVDALLHMLKRNSSLKTLYVNNCTLSEPARRTLSKITKIRKDVDLEV